MAQIWHELMWTQEEVEQFKKNAMLKRLEADAALEAAVDIEIEYWNQVLAKKFPELEDDFRRNFVDFRCRYFYGKVAFSDETAECIVSLPQKTWGGAIRDYHAIIKVWHKKADGKKYRRDCVAYRCDEIIPFLSDVIHLPKNTEPSEDDDWNARKQITKPNTPKKSKGATTNKCST